jgi:hypothetical protein
VAKKPRKKPKAYDPLASPYKYQQGFNRAIKRRARGQIQPALQDIAQRRREATSGHQAREQDLNNFYNFDLTARTAGQNALNSAIQGVVGSVGGYNGDAQAGLSAALRQQATQQGDAAKQLGVSAPNTDPAYLNTIAAYGGANNMSLAGQAAGIMGRSAADTAQTGVEGVQAQNTETDRYKALIDSLTQERSDVRSQLPGILAQTRSEMSQAEQARAGQAFQQNLAQDQFGETKRTNRFNERMSRKQQKLAQDQFGESKTQNKFARKMDAKRYGLDKGQLDLAKQQLKVDAADKVNTALGEQAKADAQRFDKASSWLDGYLKPNDQDKKQAMDPTTKTPTGKPTFDPKLWRHNRSFDEALRQLQSKFGLSLSTAYKILASAPIPHWRTYAESLLFGLQQGNRMKNRPH